MEMQWRFKALRMRPSQRGVLAAILVSGSLCTLPAGADDAADPTPPSAAPATEAPSVLPSFPRQSADEALKKFEPATPSRPEDEMQAEALAWFMTAQVRYSRGDAKAGLEALKKSVEKEQKSLAPYRVLVPALLESGQTEEAKKFALEAAKRRPDGAGLAQGVALFLARTNRIPDAITLLKDALESVPESTAFAQYLSIRRQLGTFERVAGHHDLAAEHYKIVFEALLEPGDRLKPSEQKDLLGDAGVTYDEFGQVFLLASQPELALKAFDEAAKHRTSRPGVHSFNLALLFRQTSKSEKALEELEKYFAAQLQSKGRDAYQLLKDILADLGKQDELLERLQKLNAADPENAPLAFFLADEYLARDQLKEAKQTYESAPGGARDPRALVGLSTIHRKLGEYGELLDSLTRAFQSIPLPRRADELPAAADPELRAISNNLVAEMKAITNDSAVMEGVVKHATQLKDQDPPKLDFPQSYVLGKLCIDAKRSSDALTFYKLAISMQNQPSLTIYDEIARHLVDAERYQDAVNILEEAIQHPSFEQERWIFQALQCAALEMLGETDRGLAVIQDARRQQPRNAYLHYREGWINYHAQRWPEAIRIFEEVLASGEKDGADSDLLNTCRFSLSAIYVHLDEFDKGEKILEDVLKSDPENTQANNDLGYLWADRNKNLDQARGMIEKALTKEPENAAYLDSMGWVLYRLGQYAEAKEHLLKATAKPRGEDATIWDHLGDVQDKLGEREDAIKSWLKAWETESAKPKPDEKLVKALKEKIPAERIPASTAKDGQGDSP